MIRSFRATAKVKGFTLIELAIVLAVTGVLFVGLYRLLSGGNQQVKDTAAASQQLELISAVKTFLSSSNGSQWMGVAAGADGNTDINPASPINLALPSGPTVAPGYNGNNTACYGFYGNDANKEHFCDSLPIGFNATTVNSYGQTYVIQVLPGPIFHPSKTPTTFSFMIASAAVAGGSSDVISDADGGRISSQMGSDGGFVYSNTSACPSGYACGAFGSWQTAVSAYGFSSIAPGHLVSRTYYSPDVGSLTPWLARLLMPNDTAASSTSSPNYNTMTTPLYLGGFSMFMAGTTNTAMTISSAGQISPAASGVFHLQGDSINMEAGGIFDTQSNGNAFNISPYPGDVGGNGLPYLSSAKSSANALVRLNTNCSVDQQTATENPNILNYTAGDSASNVNGSGNDCQQAINIHGDENVIGMLQATTLYATTFIYNNSDMRLKTNIQPIPHALDSIMRMKPVSFAFKAGNQKSLGFLAQDLETVYPDLVKTPPKDGFKSVNYEGLIAPLVAAVQELKEQNDDLRRQLHDQAAREDRLEQALKAKGAAPN